MRARLVYWVRDRMAKVGITSDRQLAGLMGAPTSNVGRWVGKKGTGNVPLVWLGALSHALRVDPVWFTLLPEIPADPLAPYTLPEDDPLLVAIDAARLARKDRLAAGAVDPPAEGQRPSQPRKRAASGGR